MLLLPSRQLCKRGRIERLRVLHGLVHLRPLDLRCVDRLVQHGLGPKHAQGPARERLRVRFREDVVDIDAAILRHVEERVGGYDVRILDVQHRLDVRVQLHELADGVVGMLLLAHTLPRRRDSLALCCGFRALNLGGALLLDLLPREPTLARGFRALLPRRLRRIGVGVNPRVAHQQLQVVLHGVRASFDGAGAGELEKPLTAFEGARPPARVRPDV
mmetsp:Transcript_11033/g.31429  ORF Transcript_11033/g.31429 Transcript_11033/m.31429 type:complete len:217 (+) Transcript_11033:488-1138(+)